MPSPELNNWELPGLNNYRQNVQGEGVFNAPDLALLGLDASQEDCPDMLRLRARVINQGALGVPAGVPVAFYEGTTPMADALIGVVRTPGPLLPGQSALLEVAWDVAGMPPFSFVAVADDDGTGMGEVAECREDDDAAVASIGGVMCPSLI